MTTESIMAVLLDRCPAKVRTAAVKSVSVTVINDDVKRRRRFDPSPLVNFNVEVQCVSSQPQTVSVLTDGAPEIRCVIGRPPYHIPAMTNGEVVVNSIDHRPDAGIAVTVDSMFITLMVQ